MTKIEKSGPKEQQVRALRENREARRKAGLVALRKAVDEVMGRKPKPKKTRKRGRKR